MVTVTCNNKDCANDAIEYNVFGNPPYVECGGCKAHLTPTNHRDDPPTPEQTPRPLG